jgi:hypothetical protein
MDADTTRIYADKIMITPYILLFPENSDRPGIHRESQPALYTWAGGEA